MSFDAVLGQEKAIRLIRAGILRDRVAHAYLFYRSPGRGKAPGGAGAFEGPQLPCRSSR